MRIEFSEEAEAEGSVAVALSLFKGFTFDFHMKDGAVMTGEIQSNGFWRSRPTIRIVEEDCLEYTLIVDEIDKAVYC